MVRIELETRIAAPKERCFDLARSIDLHMVSTEYTGERAIAGVTSGLIGYREEVTWTGRHFGFRFRHTSRITQYQRPDYFQDSMVRGVFKRFCHDHVFEDCSNATLMRDIMEFEAPLGFLGRMLEHILLKKHLTTLLLRRNECIRKTAEGDEWNRFVPSA